MQLRIVGNGKQQVRGGKRTIPVGHLGSHSGLPTCRLPLRCSFHQLLLPILFQRRRRRHNQNLMLTWQGPIVVVEGAKLERAIRPDGGPRDGGLAILDRLELEPSAAGQDLARFPLKVEEGLLYIEVPLATVTGSHEA